MRRNIPEEVKENTGGKIQEDEDEGGRGEKRGGKGGRKIGEV